MLKHKILFHRLLLGLVVVSAGPLALAQPPAAAPDLAGPPAAGVPVQQPLNGDFIRTSQVLGIPSSFCGHVIDLMMRNQMRRQHGLVGHVGRVHLPHLSVGLTPGDLQVTGVHLVSDGDACNGPVFEICLHNCSQVPIGNFRVSVVGVLGQICPHSPTADLCVPRLEAGQQIKVQLQLPFTCLTMGPQQQPFDTVIVAADSHDELLECDELNNVLIVKRCDIVGVVAEVPAEAQAPAQGAPVSPAAPVDPVPEDPADGQQPVSPLDDIDVEQLQLGTAQAAILQR